MLAQPLPAFKIIGLQQAAIER
ncbi:MAG: hypothetical protein RLZZ237_3194, partial [Pseudomonadota bacterium]